MMRQTYPLGIVGESQYQPAIKRCKDGEVVYVEHEPHNVYDALALKVGTRDGATIGYIARDSWLRSAMHDQGYGCHASILSIERGTSGKFGVVLTVELNDQDIGEPERSREASGDVSGCRVGQGNTWLADLLKRLFAK